MAVEELYCSLNKLLEDICKFLTDETNYKNLSRNSRKQADELINRSKHQLQEISKVSLQNDCDGAYVDMEKKSVESNEDDSDNIYTSVDEVISSKPIVIHQPQNPYENLPAKELSRDAKHGSLSWKCKFILKFEKIRRIYAGVHDNWLLIYSSEKDSKPSQTFHLRYHKAQSVPCKQGKNLSQDFELIGTEGEKKSFYFIASTHKDMLQWITQINECYDSLNKNDNLSSISEEDISETYDTIPELKPKQNSDEDDENSIYNPVEFLPSNHELSENKPPELPLRRPPKTQLLMSSPSVEQNKKESSESLSSTYDPVQGPEESNDSSTSFSDEDDDDVIYEQPCFIPKLSPGQIIQINQSPKTKETENVTKTSNSTQARQKPVTPAKPKFLKETSRTFILKK